MSNLYKGKYQIAMYDSEDILMDIFDNIQEATLKTKIPQSCIRYAISSKSHKVRIKGEIFKVYLISSYVITKSKIVSKLNVKRTMTNSELIIYLQSLNNRKIYKFLNKHNLMKVEIFWILNYKQNNKIKTNEFSVMNLLDNYRELFINNLIEILNKERN